MTESLAGLRNSNPAYFLATRARRNQKSDRDRTHSPGTDGYHLGRPESNQGDHAVPAYPWCWDRPRCADF